MPSAQLFREVWNSFWKKQTWDFDLHCPLCARPGFKYEVNEVVADGLCIGIQRSRCPKLHTPKDVFADDAVVVDMKSLDRTRFTHNKKTQTNLLRLVVTYFGYFKRDIKVAKFSPQESAAFINSIKDMDRYYNFILFFLWADDTSNVANLTNASFVSHM